MSKTRDTADTISLRKLRTRIQREAPFIGLKPYSHNIVSLTLREIAEKHGTKEANKALRDFGLAAKGFNEEPESE